MSARAFTLVKAACKHVDEIDFRCRDNLNGQREMAGELSKNVQKAVKEEQLKNKKNAVKVGKWSERPGDLFKLMGKFCNLPKVQHHLENMATAFEVKLRLGFVHK